MNQYVISFYSNGIIFHWMDRPYFINTSVKEPFVSILVYYEKWWHEHLCTCFCVGIYFLFCWVLFRNGISGWRGNFMFYCLKNCQNIFQSSCTILHSHQQCTKVLIPPYPQKHLSFSVCFLIIDILMSVGCYLTVTLLMTFFKNLFFIEV